jgi:hypothetical protein
LVSAREGFEMNRFERVLPIHGLLLTLLLLTLVNCGPPAPIPDESVQGWEGIETEEGGIRTVRTTGGAVWESEGRLIEEVAIGTETRGEFDVLGRVLGMEVADRQIFVLDGHDATVRVYDWGGNHLRNIGRRGEGPGEMGNPTDMGIDFGRGQIIVREASASVLRRFTLEGDFVGSHPPLALIAESGDLLQLRVTRDGRSLSRTRVVRFGPEVEGGFQQDVKLYTLDSLGTLTDSLRLPVLDYQENILKAYPNPRSYRPQPVPFAPQYVWSVDFEGSLIDGYPEEYALEISHPGGGRTVIRRDTPPVPVQGGERSWASRRTYGIMQDFEPGWRWEGPDIPETKAWYTHIIPDRSGRIWVLREGEGHETGDDSEPTDWRGWDRHQGWVSEFWFDVFEEESGHYLGRVKTPDGFLPDPEPFIWDDTFVCLTEDELGRPIVRRYRLELPGAQSQADHG